MKVKFFIFFFVLVPLLCFSQEKNIEQLYSEIFTQEITKGHFVQNKKIKKLNHTVTSDGNFIIHAHKGIIFKIDSPYSSVMVVTKNKLIQKMNDGSIYVMDGSQNSIFLEMADIISSVFSNNLEKIQENFSMELEKKDKNFVLHLIPFDSMMKTVINQIDIFISCTIDAVVLTENSGDSVEYIFTEHIYPDRLLKDEEEIFNW